MGKGRDGVLLVPKLLLGNVAFEAPASLDMVSWSFQEVGSQAGAWEPAQNNHS